MHKFLFPISNSKLIHSSYGMSTCKNEQVTSSIRFSMLLLLLCCLQLSSATFAQERPTNYSNLTDVNGKVFFTATDAEHGNELWRSDGTATGTYMVKDITPGESPTVFSYLTNLNGTLFFIANEGETSYQLWKSDGTTQGTVMVKEVPLQLPLYEYDYDNDFAYYRASVGLISTNNLLYFTSNNAINKYELWRTDGTEAGTFKVIDKTTSSRSYEEVPNFENFISIGNTLYFDSHGALYKTEGTSQSTVLIKEAIGPQLISAVNSIIYFKRFVLGKYQLWKSDGTAQGTALVKEDINPVFGGAVGNTLLFTFDNGIIGEELWKSDGTEAGTTLVKDIYPRNGSGHNRPNGSSPRYLTNFNNALYFTAGEGINGSELWKSDGTAQGTTLIKDITPGSTSSLIYNLLVANKTLYFVYNYKSLWKSDGTPNGTLAVKNSIGENRLIDDKSLINSNGTLYFITKQQFLNEPPKELWKSDGTEAGTVDIFASPNTIIKKEWDKTIGGNSNDELSLTITTTDNGYLLAGTSYSGISADKTQATKGSTDYWIVKLNSSGVKLWDKPLAQLVVMYLRLLSKLRMEAICWEVIQMQGRVETNLNLAREAMITG